ncbi:MAG: RNB domain-containing ribonuclease, partial [Clostridiales bacterium]|nr:RNB domain-containing ribonuclease [Clostridiales bacterium]
MFEKSKGTSAENIINQVTLRSLKKARYSTENAGHFGLASSAYSHFTSPIRRYPDLAAHRVITDYIEGKMDYQRLEQLEKELAQISKHSSERERNAIDAERQVDAMKKAEYMQQFIGKSFDAVVSGVANTAIFVELENTVEGVIPLSEIRSDYFVYFKELY